MAKLINQFNPKPPTKMHIDLNSCFAAIEQQANPKLRGKPIAVAAYTTPSGYIVAPSVEAKRLGIKVGMRVKGGKMICRGLIVLAPDPMKYRNVHLGLKKIIADYTDNFLAKSIDEFTLDLEGYPSYQKGMVQTAREIKSRIKKEVGDFLTVSIGIGPNRFLAKTAAGLHKPDGLDFIDQSNFLPIYSRLTLPQLNGIKVKNTARLNQAGIFTVLDFYQAPVWQTKAAFQSILGYYWFLRLHGWEIDEVVFDRKSFGNSFALPKPLVTPEQLSPILQKLVEKTGIRLRKAGYRAKGIHIAIVYRDFSYWHKGVTLANHLFDSRDIYKMAFKIMSSAPYRKPVRELAESVFGLEKTCHTQLALFDDIAKKEQVVKAVDSINEKYGSYVITPARMLGTDKVVLDRVAFGNIKELEDMVIY